MNATLPATARQAGDELLKLVQELAAGAEIVSSRAHEQSLRASFLVGALSHTAESGWPKGQGDMPKEKKVETRTIQGREHPVLKISEADLKALPEYSGSIPTGKTIGKRWKRNTKDLRSGQPDPEWVIGEYTRYSEDGQSIEITWYAPEVVG